MYNHRLVKITFAFLCLSFCLAALYTGMIASAAQPGEIHRFAGQDRLGTACSVSRAIDELSGSDCVIIANGLNFPDALAGVPLAASENAPILLSDGKTIDENTWENIIDISPKKVYILGGEYAVSEEVEQSLDSKYDTERVFGQSRYDTALAVARLVSSSDAACAFICSGENFPDALSISPVAGALNAPIVFSNSKGELSDEVLDFLKSDNKYSEIFIIGGVYAVGEEAEKTLADAGCKTERVFGESRYDTSAAIMNRFSDVFSDEKLYSFASGENFPDALTGSVYSALRKMPLLLLSNNYTNSAIEEAINDKGISQAYVYGGIYAVSEKTLQFLFDGDASTPMPIVPTKPVLCEKYADGFSAPDYSSKVVAGLKINAMYNCEREYADDSGTIWLLIRQDRDTRFWVCRDDIVIPKELLNGEHHIKRKLTVKVDSAKIYSGRTYSSSSIAVASKGRTFDMIGEGGGSDGLTWFKVSVNGKQGWICRTDLTIVNSYVAIKDRAFTDSHVPVIYLSPSKQKDNAFATGGTTEKIEMEAVAKIAKQILDAEYNCKTFIATPNMDLDDRTFEALGYNADIYLAIHSNATAAIDKHNKHGAEVYYFPACGQAKILSSNIVKQLNKIAPATPNVETQLHDGMKSFDNIGYNEVRRPSDAGMIAMLAETEYHDNKLGSDWIRAHRTEIARAYVSALVETFGIKKK